MFTRRLVQIAKQLQKTPSSKNQINNIFTLLTYNILSPHYIWPQVYTYVPDKYKDWNYRHKLLEYELFKMYKADIICLQELTSKDYNNFWKVQMKSKLNYDSEYVSKSPPNYWKKPLEDMDGVGIFYNLNKFNQLSSEKIHLNDVGTVFDTYELKYLSEQIIQLVDGAGNPTQQNNLLNILSEKNQVCLFVMLQHKETDSFIIVVNTHLYWKYEEVQLFQCLIIMRKLQNFIKKLLLNVNNIMNCQIKILFSGDLNSSNDSLVLKFLRGEQIADIDMDLKNPMHKYLNHSFYDDIKVPLFDNTCYSCKTKGIFDYIWFHERDFNLKKVLSGVEVKNELDFRKEIGLPNKKHPSDHIPIFVELEIIE